jgi:hypothetical protein
MKQTPVVRRSIYAFWYCILSSATIAMAEPEYLAEGWFHFVLDGFFCEKHPDFFEDNPLSERGQIGVYDDPPDLAGRGNIVPGLYGVGVGFFVGIKRQEPDLALTVRLHKPQMGNEEFSEWPLKFNASGLSWAGTNLYDEFDLGRYSFSVLNGTQVLMVDSFQVVPPEEVPELAALCPGLLSKRN